jgi:hypothetical protein
MKDDGGQDNPPSRRGLPSDLVFRVDHAPAGATAAPATPS